jgi:hypothetical protein
LLICARSAQYLNKQFSDKWGLIFFACSVIKPFQVIAQVTNPSPQTFLCNVHVRGIHMVTKKIAQKKERPPITMDDIAKRFLSTPPQPATKPEKKKPSKPNK